MLKQLLVIWACVIILVSSHSNQTLYELLQLSDDATSDEIKKSFRKLSIKYHPDRNTGVKNIQKKYLTIKRAYEILIDVSKRNTYDLFGEQGLAEIQKKPKPKGGDYWPEMPVNLAVFYTGGELVYPFRRGEICKHCKGSGDQSGKLQTCSVCQGTGKIKREVKVKDTIKTIEMKCKECKGSGHAGLQKCSVCRGQKITMAPRNLKFQVEKGMRDKDKIMFKGQSEQGFQFYPGDVILTLRQNTHPIFKRTGNDLHIKMKISLKEAMLGFDRSIKHLDQHLVLVEGHQNIQNGEQIKVVGQGMPIRGQYQSYGDLVAEVDIKFPTKYTFQQLQELRQIFDTGRISKEEL